MACISIYIYIYIYIAPKKNDEGETNLSLRTVSELITNLFCYNDVILYGAYACISGDIYACYV